MKQIFFLAVVVLLGNVALAQQNVHFGIKGGVNFANLKDENNNPDSKTGFNAGVLAHIHISKAFAVQPEIVYSTQGAEYASGTMKLDYINVPVLAQYMFADGFRLQTGPQLGILTSSEFKSGGTETNMTGIKNADLGWAFGASYLTHTGLGIDARYNMGLTDVAKNSSTDIKNRVWQLGLFYQFMHHK